MVGNRFTLSQVKPQPPHKSSWICTSYMVDTNPGSPSKADRLGLGVRMRLLLPLLILSSPLPIPSPILFTHLSCWEQTYLCQHFIFKWHWQASARLCVSTANSQVVTFIQLALVNPTEQQRLVSRQRNKCSFTWRWSPEPDAPLQDTAGTVWCCFTGRYIGLGRPSISYFT